MPVIQLTKGKSTVVDDADFAALSRYSWHVTSMGYAARNICLENGRRTIVLMHRVLLGAVGRHTHVDHANGDKLDNRRTNIRLCSNSQNKMNAGPRANKVHSQFKGVTFDTSRDRWMAQIQANGKHTYLGRFSDEQSAALAYNAAALKMHGEFARLNSL